MNYIDLLKLSHQKFNSIICLGLDPVIEDIPLTGDPKTVIIAFFEEILNRLMQKKIYPAAVKPNYAFYAQYGLEGLEALLAVIALFKKEGFPVIFDAKRGDIGKTATAYAREAFDVFQADAVTVSPYLGSDSIIPFFNQYPDKGCYVLTKTSNPSSSEIQDLMVEQVPLYEQVAKKIVEWYRPGIGSVAGATFPEQLSTIALIFLRSGNEVPILIPGIGTQGGTIAEVMSSLAHFENIGIHRLNASSAITYAYKQWPKMHYAVAAARALKDFNDAVEACR